MDLLIASNLHFGHASRSVDFRAALGICGVNHSKGEFASKWLRLILGWRTRAPQDPSIYMGGLPPPTPPLKVGLRLPYLLFIYQESQ